MALKQDYEFLRGDTAQIPVQLFEDAKRTIPLDITSLGLIFSVKLKNSDLTFLFQKKNAAAGGGSDQLEVTDGPAGEALIKPINADTVSLLPGPYEFDLRTPQGVTLVYGHFIIKSHPNFG